MTLTYAEDQLSFENFSLTGTSLRVLDGLVRHRGQRRENGRIAERSRPASADEFWFSTDFHTRYCRPS